MKSVVRTAGVTLAFFIVSGVAVQTADAAGFYVREQSTAAMSTGFAGSASRGDNSSFLFYNPAAIILNDSIDVTGDFKLFVPSLDITGSAATRPAFPQGTGAPVVGETNTGEMTGAAIAPTFFASYAITEDLRVGIGGSGPFAALVDADDPWVGRFQVTETSYRTYNFNPVMAYRINEMLTVGAGVQVQYFEADMRNSQALPPPFGPFEGEGFLQGNDWGFGFTAGLLFQPSEDTTIGIGYRSRIEHDLSGKAGVNSPAPGPNLSVDFDIDTPDVVTASISHRLNEYVEFHATFEWVNWSLFDDITVKFDAGLPSDVRPQNWKDVYSGFFGVSYMASEQITLNLGGGFTSSTGDGTGSAILPDGERYTVAVGVSHAMSEHITFNASYAHVFFDIPTLTPGSIPAGTLVGDADLDLDIISLSVTGHW